MKPKKRTLTSKALTLRLVCAALVMVFLACILGFYTPFPTQVIDQSEKEFSTGPTEALERHWFGTTSAYLLGSENSLSLLFCQYSPFFGWTREGYTSIDLSQEDGPVWTYTYFYSENEILAEGASGDIHHFGRVVCPNAESVRIIYPSNPPEDALTFPLFRGEDHHLHFWGWHTISWHQSSPIDYFDVDIEVLDAEGNVLYTYETNPSYTEEELGKTELAPS